MTEQTAPTQAQMMGRIIEMTEEERQALPGQYHQPHWDGMGSPHSWICQVCWGDGWQTLWPCEVATREGKAVAEASGMSFSW